MQHQISELNENEQVFENQHVNPLESTWKDEVKEKFFSEHISPLRETHNQIISQMQQTASEFERTESKIRNLMY